MDIKHIDIDKCKGGQIYKFTEPDPNIRAQYHEVVRGRPELGLRLLTKYITNGFNVRCDTCYGWTSDKDSSNACCEGGCSCSQQRVRCKHCSEGDDELGYLYYDNEDIKDEIKAGKIRRIWESTGEMYLMEKGTSYKAKDCTFRKRYKNLRPVDLST